MGWAGPKAVQYPGVREGREGRVAFKCSKSVDPGDFWAGAGQGVGSGPQTWPACARLGRGRERNVGITEQTGSMPRSWVQGWAFGDTPEHSSKGLSGFAGLSAPQEACGKWS